LTLARIAMPSPCYSSRGATCRLIVLHTAEGATTIESLGNFFADPGNQVSSHAGADDKANTIGVYVKRGDKAWTQGNANPYCVSLEMCAFAAWSVDEWHAHPNMLANAAAWIAEEAAAFGIPIRRLSGAEAQGGGTGVCQHADLGEWGGGHWDCGTGFPIDEVLAMAGGTPITPPDNIILPPLEVDVIVERQMVNLRLDGDGNGWTVMDGQEGRLVVPFERFLGATVNGSNPADQGYAYVPWISANDLGGLTQLEVVGGTAHSWVGVWVAFAA
jgi:hypothetical protein